MSALGVRHRYRELTDYRARGFETKTRKSKFPFFHAANPKGGK